MFARDVRKYLDEIECPVFPRQLLGIGQAVVPSLKFVKQQHRRRVLEHLDDNFVRWDFGFRRARTLPLALHVGSVGMLFKQ